MQSSLRRGSGWPRRTETATIARSSVAKPVSRPRSRKPVTISASAMAAHLDCTRAYIRKLEGEGVLHRAPGGSGFDVDASRVAFAHLGRDAEARDAAARVLAIDPAFTISALIARGGRSNAKLLIEGLRKAGLPE